MLDRIIYKRTSTGAIQQWQQDLLGDSYRTISGQVDGKLVTSEWTVCESKNVGRANETTPTQQALLEVTANYKKKLAQGGYCDNIEDIDNVKFREPMRAKDFDDYAPTYQDYGLGLVYSQPKLDGMRCIANKDGLWSRQGKPIISVPHIFEALQGVFEQHPDLILDGELYGDKLKHDFNKIMSLCKKKKPTVDNFHESAEKIQYWFYDLPSCEGVFSHRMDMAKRIIPSTSCLVPVETTKVISQEHMDELYAYYLEIGAEGQICRIDGPEYEYKRTKFLLKRKTFVDEEFVIVGVLEGVGNRSGMAGKLLYALPNGDTFKSGIKGDFDYFKELLDNSEKYIGSEATVKFFNYTPDGIPRFPVTITIYDGIRDS